MIKEKRKSLGLKVANISRELGCSKSTIYQIEHKKRGGDIFGRYMRMLQFKPTDITRIRTGLPHQTDIED